MGDLPLSLYVEGGLKITQAVNRSNSKSETLHEWIEDRQINGSRNPKPRENREFPWYSYISHRQRFTVFGE